MGTNPPIVPDNSRDEGITVRTHLLSYYPKKISNTPLQAAWSSNRFSTSHIPLAEPLGTSGKPQTVSDVPLDLRYMSFPDYLPAAPPDIAGPLSSNAWPFPLPPLFGLIGTTSIGGIAAPVVQEGLSDVVLPKCDPADASAQLQFQTPNQVKQDYSPRVTQLQWIKHESVIRLMHEEGKSRKHMLQTLASVHSFRPTLWQLNAQMQKWELKVYGKSGLASGGVDATVILPALPEEEVLGQPKDGTFMESTRELALQAADTTDDQSDISLTEAALQALERSVPNHTEATKVTHTVRFAAGTPSPNEESCLMNAPKASAARSIISHCTRSTFNTHASDSSSLRDFRSTATRVYKANKIRKRTSGHAGELARILDSSLFQMADDVMFADGHESLLRASASAEVGLGVCARFTV
jgi:hypothetical protein